MAIDFTSWTTYLQAALAATLAWVVKTMIQLGKDQVKLETVIQYYVERQTKDAAIRLDIPNPAPPDIRRLLQKHIQGEVLTDEERPLLSTWLQNMGTNPEADAAERSAALQMLTGIKTEKLFRPRRKGWWWFAKEIH